MKRTSLAFLAALALAGCGDPSGGPDRPDKPFFIKLLGFRHDIRTITVAVPAMKSEACQKLILEALGKAEGVMESTPNIEARTVDVKYDALKLGIKNIEYVIAGVGFDAGETPASKEAKDALPAECR